MQDNILETSALSRQVTSLRMLAEECNHRVVMAVKIAVLETRRDQQWL